jgi:biopolymer transport protein ExbD
LTQIDLKLPNADAAPQQEKPNEIRVLVSSDGHYVVQKNRLKAMTFKQFGLALAAAAKETANPLVVISADARASHQSVIQVLEAAQNAGLQQVTFTAQSRSQTTVLPVRQSCPDSVRFCQMLGLSQIPCLGSYFP